MDQNVSNSLYNEDKNDFIYDNKEVEKKYFISNEEILDDIS